MKTASSQKSSNIFMRINFGIFLTIILEACLH